ncbi:hypothetical protein [Intrasporangium sp.]|uniref:hypothetical protein n=1 Tax=Intrasporangium sp. TaxID=1925024 RepID=UPI00293BAB84|nr:hypothetical protein [Intrasporangium sp.]
MRPIDCQRIRRPGVAGHRALHPREVVDVEGLQVVGLADTWVDLGELVGRGKPMGVDDLVVAGDAVASVQGNRAGLLRRLSIRVRPRGKVALLEAYESIRVGSASPRETLARLMLVRSGLPEPKLNHPIYASWDPSVLLGVGDLVWEFEVDGRLVRVVGEYQGEAFHAGRAQQRRDGWRRRGLEDDGWLVIEIWKRDMASTEARRATVLRFAEALAFPIEELSLTGAEPRFFSRHALELAEQRDVARRYRSA